MSKHKILLIAYKFPPFAGVGCFRWTKLTKYLAKLGHEIHVITVDWNQLGVNTFISDVSSENITIHKIASNYPYNLKHKQYKNRSINFLKNSFVELLEKAIFWDDEAQHWGDQLVPYAIDLIKELNIPTVIATGHPFNANYWAAQIKKELPELSLIQDFRDPWVQHKLKRYSSIKRKKIAQSRMIESIKYADAVVTVTSGLSDIYRESARNKIKVLPSFITISNGYDEDDMPSSYVERTPTLKDRIVITHIGSISNRRDIPCCKFLDYIANTNFSFPILIQFAGSSLPDSIMQKYQHLFDAGICIYKGMMSPQDAYLLVAQSDFALQLNADIVPYLVSTKIFEYAGISVPTISLNYGGDIEALIHTHNLGVSINLNTPNAIQRLDKAFNTSTQYSFDITQYSYTNLALQYSKLISDTLKQSNLVEPSYD